MCEDFPRHRWINCFVLENDGMATYSPPVRWPVCSWMMLIFTHTVTFSTIIRFKVETQLVSWLQKYDLEMADKQVELDEFTQKYEEEVEKCEKLQVTIV